MAKGQGQAVVTGPRPTAAAGCPPWSARVDLDIKQHASIENIAPAADVAEAEAGTYNLDVRPMADCDKIRPRLLKPVGCSVHVTG
eukprot:Skav228062  [mRNA]  locus=scaffold2067:156725:164273:+ [translate_table: standard]